MDGTRFNWKEFNNLTNNLAIEFYNNGIRKGMKVGILLPNSLKCVFAQYGLIKLGAICIPLSTRYRRFELTYMLKHSDATYVMTIDNFLGTDFIKLLNEISPNLPNLRGLILTGGYVPEGAISLDSLIDKASLKESSDAQRKLKQIETPRENDTAIIMYTSGSTGNPKGAVLSHRNLIWDAERVVDRLSVTHEDVFIVMLPLSHGFASFVLLPHAIMAGSKIVVVELFVPEKVLETISKEKVTLLYGVPTMFKQMLDSKEFGKYDLSSLRTGYMSGADCPPPLVKAVIEDMGCNICVGYGMTETMCQSIPNWDADKKLKLETAGLPLPGVSIRIVDNDRKEVPRGTIGEIAVKGENVFSGYYKRPDMTYEIFDKEGWFYTGDSAMRDEEGLMRIVGRKKDMLIRGGFNVYPSELEEVLHLHPKVSLVVVVGMPDEVFGEAIVACIVARQGEKISEEEIIGHCKSNLANYKIPNKIIFMDEFPMTSSNKIQKYKIKEKLLKEGI